MAHAQEEHLKQNCWNTQKRKLKIIINFDDITGDKKNIIQTSHEFLIIHTDRILTAGGSGSGKIYYLT